MGELIPFQERRVGTDLVPTVNGQDIYDFLGITKAYATWIKTQIRRTKLVENRDYVVFSSQGKNPQGGRPSTEYHFTFDGATHISMISSATKGYQVREFFIAAEKRLRMLQEEEDKHPLVKQARAIARLEARQDMLEATVASIKDRQPPAEIEGKFTVPDWLRFHSKPFLPHAVLDHLKTECRKREEPKKWRPNNLDYPLLYYSPKTIEDAYVIATRQLSFIQEAGVPYERRKRR